MPTDRIALVTGANQGVGKRSPKNWSRTMSPCSSDRAIWLVARQPRRRRREPRDPARRDDARRSPRQDRIRAEFGRLDLLVNNAAISNTRRGAMSIEDYARTSRASTASLDEIRAVWETNVFGVVAVYQAMLPLLRESSDARIVNVSSGVGSLTRNADPAFPYRAIFGPGYAASKTALNAMTLAMMIELELTNIKVTLVPPGLYDTNLNGYEGTEPVEEGSREVVRVALLGPDGPSGTFTGWENATIPW